MEHSILNAFVVTRLYITVDTATKHSVDIYIQLEYDNIHDDDDHHHHQLQQQQEGESHCRLFPSSTVLISPTRILQIEIY